MSWQDAWVDRFYRSRPHWKDGTTEFHELCASLIQKNAKILEIGAGPTNPTSAFLATLGELHGVDVSDEVHGNVHLARSSVVSDGPYPYEDSTFDVAVSNYVVEHVPDVRTHLAEVARVLKPGAAYVFRTPNLWHYVAITSRLTPHSVHKALANRLRTLAKEHHEPWPTVYAMNTERKVRKLALEAGLTVRTLEMCEKEPSYGMYARPLFLTLLAYERVVNATPLLAPFRANLFVVLGKDRPRTA